MSEMNAETVMELSDIRKTYREGKLKTEVLKGVSLSIPKGALMALVGASGSGKSTLLHIMGTLDRPTSGDVIFEGEKVSSWGESRQAEFRNKKLGFVYQFHHLLREFTALENVMMPEIIGGSGMAEAREKAEAMLERVGLKERMDHRPSELSGGERQRTAIARALVNSPDLVLADEPTGNLDFRAAGSVMDLIEELHGSLGMAFVVVTHDRDHHPRRPRRGGVALMFRPLSVCVGLRFSRGRSTSGFVSFISASSVIGIAIGVIALIVGLSAMNGFEYELHHRVLSVIPEAEVRAESGEFVNPAPYMKRLLEGQGIRGASVFTEADAIAGNGLKFKAVRARGIDPSTTGSTLGLREFMTPGSLESLTPGSRSAVLGKKVAEKLGVKKGDAITLLAVRKSGGADSSGVPSTESLPFKVTGTFSIGGELDGALVFVSVADAGELTGLGPRIS